MQIMCHFNCEQICDRKKKKQATGKKLYECMNLRIFFLLLNVVSVSDCLTDSLSIFFSSCFFFFFYICVITFPCMSLSMYIYVCDKDVDISYLCKYIF